MTDEHVWVTLADGKRLYVGKLLGPAKIVDSVLAAEKEQRKRKRAPSPAPKDILDAIAGITPEMRGVKD